MMIVKTSVVAVAVLACTVTALAQEPDWSDEKNPVWNQVFENFYGMKMTFPVPNLELKAALSCLKAAESDSVIQFPIQRLDDYAVVFGENSTDNLGVYFFPSVDDRSDKKEYNPLLSPSFMCWYDVSEQAVVNLLVSK